jgi:DNA mismatch repair protein MutS2
LKPTYKLLIGVPGKSNAFAISRRLGLPEEIIESARSTVSENDTNFEDVLDQLEQQRQQMEAAREEAERLRKETEQTKQKSDEYYAEMKKQKERAEAQARKEAQRILDEARRTANSVYEELKALRKQMKDAADAQGVNARQAELRRQLNEAEEKLAPKQDRPERPKPSREIRVGDTVELLKLGTHATVLALNKDGTYQLQAGILKVNVKPDEVYLLENEPQEVKKYIEKTRREFKNQAQSPELDLRGMDALEAGAVLTIFLDNAYMANLTQVRIIHGKGTGVLRKTVHDELKKNKHVKKYRLGVYGEGEDGVTIAELA